MSERCKTKYPIMLIHGVGARDFKRFNYWGRIPKALQDNGAVIFYGHQDSWASIESNAQTIKENMLGILEETGCEKFNVIAHSKGGLEARYLISSLDMADKIASLTTIATPHHGSQTIDRILMLPEALHRCAAFLVDSCSRLIGDSKPDFYRTSRNFSTTDSKKFNEENPDSPGVYYQSYAAVMRSSLSDITLLISHCVIKSIEGENDGLVSAKSAVWANYKGELRGASRRGISHTDAIDLRRKRLTKATKVNAVSDITDKYIQIVSELKEMGF